MKGPLFKLYYALNHTQALTVLKWISDGWPALSVASFLMKLFRDLPFYSHAFVEALCFVISDYAPEHIVNIISVIVVGEKHDVVAKFFNHWIQFSNWDRPQLVLLLEHISVKLRWPQYYKRSFLTFLIVESVKDSFVSII